MERMTISICLGELGLAKSGIGRSSVADNQMAPRDDRRQRPRVLTIVAWYCCEHILRQKLATFATSRHIEDKRRQKNGGDTILLHCAPNISRQQHARARFASESQLYPVSFRKPTFPAFLQNCPAFFAGFFWIFVEFSLNERSIHAQDLPHSSLC